MTTNKYTDYGERPQRKATNRKGAKPTRKAQLALSSLVRRDPRKGGK